MCQTFYGYTVECISFQAGPRNGLKDHGVVITYSVSYGLVHFFSQELK